MEEWKEYKLGEVCDFQEGYVNPPQGNPEYFDGDIKWLRATDLNDRYVYSTSRTLTQLGFKSAKKSAILFKPGTIVISKSGTIGRLGILQDYMCGNRAVINIIPHHTVNTFFVFFVLRNYQRYFPSMAVGSVQKNLYISILEDLKINLPDLNTQERIVSILKSLDDKIEVNRKTNENLEQQAQALFKSWFVDFEPFKNGEFVESELGMIPKGWRVGKLGEICNVFTGKKDVKQSQPKGLYPFFSCSPNHTYSNEYIYDGPSIIIAGNGSYTGRTSFYFGKFDLYQRTYACTIKEGFNEKIISFLYYMMKCLFEPVKMGGTRGSSIPYIVMNDIVLQKFALDNSLVEKYSDFAYNVMKQIQQNNQESRRLAEIRDTLLPKLMSGELKVTNMDLVNEMLEKGIR